MKPRLLDLFCGAGGCSEGYSRAGFEVVGIDVVDQPNYPFEFWQGDAMNVLEIMLTGGGLQAAIYDRKWDAIHASPPCQADSKTWRINGYEHVSLIAEVRKSLNLIGLPYVIENVKGAPLVNPIMLEGQQFGLNTHRPRLFEANWPLDEGGLKPPPPRQAKMGRRPKPGEAIQVVGNFSDVEAGRAAMGISWMTRDELAEAIPPAYTEFIGLQLLEYLDARAAA